ncbi:MAG: metallophosphoesterase family protein [Pseudomonadota bacterium]
MFFRSRKSQPRVHAIPPGERVYAIGDVHGCADELDRLIHMIDADDAARGPAQTTLVFLGDLVDRGPDSAGVVERVRQLCASGARLLKGNHEEIFVSAAKGSPRAARGLMSVGGDATLLSYGLTTDEMNEGDFNDLGNLLVDRIPRDHVRFLDAGERMIAIGDYLFVHAGIRPRFALEDQVDEDLRWIREDFLSSKVDHGVMVIHGHTISDGVDEQPNRIGIDTGAYQSGILTAIGLEGEQRWFLDTRAQGR